MNWHKLASPDSIDDLIARSWHTPCLVYKHSPRCELCLASKALLERDWPFASEQLEAYFVDVLEQRELSNRLAEQFAVQHETPQVLLLKNGDCIYEADHLEINLAELEEQLSA
jgi:bacillithiol system protein YtxJ